MAVRATDLHIPHAPGAGFVEVLRTIASSFAWSLEVRRRCDRVIASGGRLDGDTVRRIFNEADAASESRAPSH